MAKHEVAKQTGLSLTTKTPINDILAILQEKKRSFENINDSKYLTHGKVSPFPTNIKEDTSVESLIGVFASIKTRSKAYDEAQVELGVTECKAWNLDGATFEDLKSDIQLRISIIRNKDEMDELNKLLEEAKEFMTVDDKKTAYLAKLEKYASK